MTSDRRETGEDPSVPDCLIEVGGVTAVIRLRPSQDAGARKRVADRVRNLLSFRSWTARADGRFGVVLDSACARPPQFSADGSLGIPAGLVPALKAGLERDGLSVRVSQIARPSRAQNHGQTNSVGPTGVGPGGS